MRARKESVVGGMVEAHKRMFAAPGLDFVLGTAKFVGPKTVEATLADGSVRVVEGEKVLINTGTTPAIPPIEGLGDVAYWTSEDALRLTEIPDRLVILGGGVIGVEMASMMAAFGANVTLIEGGEHILAREDADVAEEMAANLAAQGVTVRTGERAMRVSSDGEGVVVHTTAGEVAGTRLLVALGRTPATKGLGLEAAGVELTERGFVKVDSRLETTAPGVYAAGDVAGKEASTEGRLIPWAVFATPELGRVGMSESEARAAGRDIRVAKVAAAAVPRAKTHGHVEGFYKVVVDAETEEILGAAIVAESASEVIAAVQTAMLGGLPWPKLRDAVIAHPTMAEGLNIVLDSLG